MQNKIIISLFCLISCFVFTVNAQVQSDKVKIVIDNDFSGDPDGLFQLAHHLLCRTCDIRAIVGGHLYPRDAANSTEISCQKANEVLALLGMTGEIKVAPGATIAMTSTDKPVESDGARIIIEEAILCTPDKPLYVCCGGSLTNVASAYLMKPEIEERVILIWIGGAEYESFDSYPLPMVSTEYNIGMSIPAAQIIFNKSRMRIWQVPRNAYTQCLYGFDEIKTKIEPYGKIGKYLSDELNNSLSVYKNYGMNLSEAYVLGDSPLVLLSSLQSVFFSDPTSSHYKYIQSPAINDNGAYGVNHNDHPIRVYTHIDTRLMFNDFEAKLKLNFPKE
jgi:inosine-uridine nucleoside N-ribohydrolase